MGRVGAHPEEKRLVFAPVEQLSADRGLTSESGRKHPVSTVYDNLGIAMDQDRRKRLTHLCERPGVVEILGHEPG